MEAVQINLGRGRQITVRRDTATIQIRLYDEDVKPTSCGLTLSLDQWNKLIMCSRAISDDFQRQKQDLEVDSVYSLDEFLQARVRHPYWLVDIRFWYQKDDQLMPTRKGIKLHHVEFGKLIQADAEVQSALGTGVPL
jgi:hypothetical protein